MGRLVVTEVRKLLSTRLWGWVLLAAVALTILFGWLAIEFAADPQNPTPPLTSPGGQRTVFSVGFGGASALVAVLGVVGMAGEYRHRTATATFLATPARGRVVGAKLMTYALAGAAIAAGCVVATLVVAPPLLRADGIVVSLTANGIPATLAAVLAAVALYGVMGAGLGALLRDQVAAASAVLIYLFVVEPVVTRVGALQAWTRYLPGPASQALTNISQAGQDLMHPLTGGLALATYATVLAVAGVAVTTRRDVL